MEKKPPNWFKYLRNLVQRERILPEGFIDEDKKADKSILSVGIKLLHHGDEDNYIIRPAQILKVLEFGGFPEEIRQFMGSSRF